jgi:hypothetical protein
MKTFKIEDFTKGWVMGDFDPVIVKSKDFEMGMKFFSAGEVEPAHFQVIATEITLIASGEVTINGVNYFTIFAVSREHIRNRSKESYKELINLVNKDKNEETAHYFERAFLAVFHPIPDYCIYK